MACSRFLLDSKADRSQQAGVEGGPGAGVEILVVDVHEVDLVKALPRYLAAVEVGDPVGGEMGDFDDPFVGPPNGHPVPVVRSTPLPFFAESGS